MDDIKNFPTGFSRSHIILAGALCGVAPGWIWHKEIGAPEDGIVEPLRLRPDTPGSVEQTKGVMIGDDGANSCPRLLAGRLLISHLLLCPPVGGENRFFELSDSLQADGYPDEILVETSGLFHRNRHYVASSELNVVAPGEIRGREKAKAVSLPGSLSSQNLPSWSIIMRRQMARDRDSSEKNIWSASEGW